MIRKNVKLQTPNEPEQKDLRCVAYCRVSTDADDQLNSLQNQQAHYNEKFSLPGYTRANIGMLYRRDGNIEKLRGIFADEGISGTSLKNRRAFKAMIEAAQRREFDIIYVKNVARFARSVEDFSKVLKDLAELGVGVIIEDGNLDSRNGAHEITLNLLAAVAQEESRSKSHAVKFGIREAQKAGKYTTCDPFGYDRVNGFLVIKPDEADTVRLIYQLYLDDGFGVAKIARKLNEEGLKTKYGKLWSQKQITTILTNPLYTGNIRLHTIESADVNRHTQVEIDPEDWIIHQQENIRIIDDATFAAVKKERARREALLPEGYRQSTGNLLSNIAFCGNCGGNLKRKKRHTLPGRDIGYERTCQYRDMYGVTRCPGPERNSIPEELLLEKIKEKIRLLQNYNMDDLFSIYSHVHFTIDTSLEHVAQLESEKVSIARSMKLNFEEYDAGYMNREEYRERNTQLKAKVDRVQKELDRIANVENDKKAARLRYEQFKQRLQNVDLDNLTNQALRAIFRHITVSTLQNPKGAIKGIKVIDYDYQFIDHSVKDLIDKMDARDDGSWAKVGKVKVELFSDLLGTEKYAEGHDD